MTKPTTETTTADEAQGRCGGPLCRIPVTVWRLLCDHRQKQKPEDKWAGFLWMLVAAAMCLSIDAYSLVTRSVGLSALHMLPLFAIGLIAGLMWLRPHDAVRRAWGVWGVLIGFVMLLTTHCLFMHPDLVFSRAGALMISPYLLTTGRAFPMLLAPLLLGLSAGAVFPRERLLKRHCLICCALVMVMGSHFFWFRTMRRGPEIPYFDKYRFRPAMFLLGLLVVCAAEFAWRRRHDSDRATWAVAAACCTAMFLIAVLVDPYGGRASLRREFAVRVAEAHAQNVSPADVWCPESKRDSRHRRDGKFYAEGMMRIPFSVGDVEGDYSRGSWTSTAASTSEVSAASVEVVAALAVAVRSDTEAKEEWDDFPLGFRMRVHSPAGVSGLNIAPGFAQRWDSVESKTPWEITRRVALSDILVKNQRKSAIVFGPGSLVRRELHVISHEALSEIEQCVNIEGTLTVWLPVGNIDVQTLRRILAGFDQVFDRYRVFAYGAEAVVVAGGAEKLKYAQWEEMFANDGARKMLENVGIWSAADLLAGYVGDQDDLKPLTDGVEPFHKGLFVRAPVLARADVNKPDLTAAAALLQYRMARSKHFTDAMVFKNDLHRKTALLGFASVYNANARDALRRLVHPDDAVARAQVRAFLAGPLARLDLLAAPEGEGVVNEARALMLFNLRDDATAVLKAQWAREQAANRQGSFELHYTLGRRLEDTGFSNDALYHYRKALSVRPDGPDVVWRIQAIEERMGGTQ